MNTQYKIPLVDLKEEYYVLKPEIDTAIADVLFSAKFIQGEKVKLFEEKFANYINSKYCIGVNSGTDALILGVRALGIEPNMEMIVPANTFFSSALAASENNLKPVFVDIDERDYGMNLDDLTSKITDKTRAIIVVHLYGQPEKINEIRRIIKESGKNIHLIEDAAQAHGALYKGNRVGSFGIFAAFSFYPGKNLGAYGDGGAITTSNEALARKLFLLREYGQSKKYYHDVLGVNSRLDSLQAAILVVKLKYLQRGNEKRKKLAALYSNLLKEMKSIQTPRVFRDRQSSYHLYVIRVPKRDELLTYLKLQGVQAIIHYPIPLHLQKAYSDLGYKKGDLPAVEKIAGEIISLPLYPSMKEEQVKYVVSKIKLFYNKKI